MWPGKWRHCAGIVYQLQEFVRFDGSLEVWIIGTGSQPECLNPDLWEAVRAAPEAPVHLVETPAQSTVPGPLPVEATYKGLVETPPAEPFKGEQWHCDLHLSGSGLRDLDLRRECERLSRELAELGKQVAKTSAKDKD